VIFERQKTFAFTTHIAAGFSPLVFLPSQNQRPAD